MSHQRAAKTAGNLGAQMLESWQLRYAISFVKCDSPIFFERIVSVLQVPQENFACAGVERKSHDMTLAGPSWQFGERVESFAAEDPLTVET